MRSSMFISANVGLVFTADLHHHLQVFVHHQTYIIDDGWFVIGSRNAIIYAVRFGAKNGEPWLDDD